MIGRDGGVIGRIADRVFIAASNDVYETQEYHIMLYHLECAYAGSELFQY